MKIRLAQRRHGIALIIVMIAVISLTILAGGFAYSMKVETRLAMNSNNDAEMEWLARSGVEYAKSILAVSNPPVSADMLEELSLGAGKVKIESYEGLEGRININTASDQVLESALVGAGADAGSVNALVAAIRDWIDPDDATHPEGAESDYYLSLPSPHRAKDGPMDDISELLFIRGVTWELYWGGAAIERAPSRVGLGRTQRVGFQDTTTLGVGLNKVFTTLSSGRIDINSASQEVLQVLPMMDERIASEVVRFRSAAEGGRFNNVGELVNIPGLTPQLVQQVSPMFDVRSRTWELHISTTIQGYTKRYIAIVGIQDPRNIQTLSFRAE